MSWLDIFFIVVLKIEDFSEVIFRLKIVLHVYGVKYFSPFYKINPLLLMSFDIRSI